MKNFYKGVYLFLFLSLAGCSLYQVATEEATFEYYPPKVSKDEVKYLDKIVAPHKVIGYVTVNAERNQKREEILDKLKKEAAKLGGDAITNITTNGGTGKWAQIKPPALFGNANVRENYIADVVVFETTQSSQSAPIE